MSDSATVKSRMFFADLCELTLEEGAVTGEAVDQLKDVGGILQARFTHQHGLPPASRTAWSLVLSGEDGLTNLVAGLCRRLRRGSRG